MEYVVMPESKTINLAPATKIEEILQNVRTILGTVKFSVPLDREFGISGDAVDKPMLQAEAILSSEIFAQIKRYEPRVSITEITFTGDINGRLTPKVTVKINETN